MDKQDATLLNELLDKHGPEKILVHVKGYCIRKAEDVRKTSGIPNSVFALGYQLLARSIASVLNEKKEK